MDFELCIQRTTRAGDFYRRFSLGHILQMNKVSDKFCMPLIGTLTDIHYAPVVSSSFTISTLIFAIENISLARASG